MFSIASNAPVSLGTGKKVGYRDTIEVFPYDCCLLKGGPFPGEK
jgi:hypothetical protein